MTATLDYTPPTTLQTLQFSSEPLNVIAISLLASFILANIGSLISRLLHLTPSNTFTYRGWLRAIIFASTDDPLRILSWLRRRYDYSDRSWNRSKSTLRPNRLFIPVCSRLFLMLVSIGLIALSIPVTTFVSGCQFVDYSPVWNISRVASISAIPGTTCIPINLQSAIGEVHSVAEYCFAISEIPNRFPAQEGQTHLVAVNAEKLGQVGTYFFNSSAAWSVVFHIQWRRLSGSAIAYNSDVGGLDVFSHLDITLAAVQDVRPECVPGAIEDNSGSDFLVASTILNCELNIGLFDISNFYVDPHLRQVIAYHITGIQWQKFGTTQKRIRGIDTLIQETYECPVLININQPMLNIVPLTIALFVSIIANLMVSWVTRRHGNALDAGYHIVKESLGYDTTTNPLEENEFCERITTIEIGRWRCTADGEGHVGFIGRHGDEPVDKFDDCTVVAQCVRAEMDLEAAQRARMGPSNES